MNFSRSVRHFGYFICSLILTGSLVGPPLVDAATYYVATTGNDSNPGTSSSPFRTVNKGVKGLKPGDTLYIKSGTYAEALSNTIPGGTSWSAPVTVAAYPGHTVTLKPKSGTGNILSFAGANKKYIIVDKLILDGTNISGMGVRISYPGSDSTQAAHHIRIKNTEIKNIPQNGVSTSKGAKYNEFINLRVHDTGLSGSGHGLYISGHNNMIESSSVYNNKKCGIQVLNSGSSVDGVIFRYNKVYNNGLSPSAPNSCVTGLWIGAGTGALVYNNLFWDNTGTGIVVGGGAKTPKVYNNTTYSNGEYGIRVLSASNTLVKNNIVYGNGRSGISNSGAGTVQANNLTSDPKFVEPAKNNFKLQASSPAISAGATLSEVKDDHVKIPRPQGSRYDVGGYEYKSSTSSTQLLAPTNTSRTQLLAPTNIRIIDGN